MELTTSRRTTCLFKATFLSPAATRVTGSWQLTLLIHSRDSLTLRAARLCHGLIRLLPRRLTLAGLPIYVARFPAAPLPVRSILVRPVTLLLEASFNV